MSEQKTVKCAACGDPLPLAGRRGKKAKFPACSKPDCHTKRNALTQAAHRVSTRDERMVLAAERRGYLNALFDLEDLGKSWVANGLLQGGEFRTIAHQLRARMPKP